MRAPLGVFVDDDNVLARDYLAQVKTIFETHPKLGCAGGKSLPEFETPPAAWVAEFYPLLAVRDLGEKPLQAAAPIERAPRSSGHPEKPRGSQYPRFVRVL
jgi:hypothetical protein